MDSSTVVGASAPGSFLGPLFVVGMPRSGTKLVRALLNQHSRVGLTPYETHFIPYFVKTFGDPPRLAQPRDRDRFCDLFEETLFYRKIEASGGSFDRARFWDATDTSTWRGVLEPLLRSFGSRGGEPNVIWGDKTPGYVRHMRLLGALFPSARFVHVLRDPRDCSLSVRRSFGKSLLRAAARWRETVGRARADGAELADRYLELRYEDLLGQPEVELRRLSAFVGLSFEARMLALESSGEDLGETRGKKGIVLGNVAKFRTDLRPDELRRLEEIVCDVARSVGYAVDETIAHKPLGRVSLLTRYFYDGYASVRRHARREGTLRFLFSDYRNSSWRG